MRNANYNKQPRHHYVINDRITGDEFRVIDDKGEQVGMYSRQEAFAHAQENDVDLVLIAPQAKPPVIKAIDYKKFLYQEEKKEKESKKTQKKSDTKDIQLSLFIGTNDMERLRNKSLEF
ncbi:MAG: translation initiation factor IF-3, partial [Candidatus Roizmanbacteria bacterium]